MMLLILDVRLPDDFHPKDGAELVQGLIELWPKFLPYLGAGDWDEFFQFEAGAVDAGAEFCRAGDPGLEQAGGGDGLKSDRVRRDDFFSLPPRALARGGEGGPA